MSTQEGEATNVKVMVRVRPFNSRELALENPDEIRSIIQMDGNTVTVLDAEHNYQERDAFEFDECFWSIPESQNQLTNKPFANQVDVFEKTGAPAVENALRGYHNTIFAYGQTGSGKTHSMLGNDANEGIAPRLVRHLFARIAEERKLNPQERVQYSVELSFLEIYNEKVKDLLLKAQQNNGARSTASSAGPVSAKEEYAECRVRQHPEKGTFVEGLMRMLIESEEQCLHAIKEGMEHRAVTSTLMNDTSSRSHAIFQICLTQKSPLKGTSRVSIINLVDLAGSERVKMSGVAGQAFTEAKAINQSLSTLRRVIDVMIDNSKLKKGQRAAVPPYRESLLTWVLSDSLGGNSRTVMVAAVSPFSGNMEDTIGTLRYALKAKAIVCHAKVNEEKTAAVVHALRSEMETLRKKLEEKQASDAAEADRLASALKEREEEWTRIQDEAKRLDALKAQYEQELSAKAEELSKAQRQMQTLDNVEEERRRKEQELAEARTRQEATARQLAEQQAERMRRDAELQAVMARKASLEANHDRSAVEEARAKLEIEQARMRQFANAFQNAFVLGKQKSGLEDLKQENIQLRQRLTDLEVQAAAAERDLAGLTTEKQTVERKVELLDRKCQAMLRDLQAVMRGKNERIDDLTARKEAVSTELDHLLRELARKQSELAKVRTMHSEETIALTERVEELHQQQQQCEADSAVKAKRLTELREQVEENRAKLEELRHALSTQQAKAQELSASVDKREAIVAELRRQREAHVKQRDEARQQLGLRRAELDAAYKDLTAVKDEVEVLQRNHKELRSFVTSHFFPAGQAAPRVAPLPPSAESYASPAPSSRRFVTGTSPAPHSPRAGTAPSSASHASSPASVAVRQYTNRGVRYEVNTPSGFATASATTPKPRR